MAVKNYKTSGFFTNTNIVPYSTSTQIGLFDGRQTTATLAKEVESRDVKGAVDGSDQTQTLDTIITSVTYTFSVEIEAIDSDTLELMFGERWAPVNFDDKLIKRDTIPSSAEIVDTDLVSGLTAADVQVSIADNGAWGFRRPLEIITTGTPTGDQVKLDTANTKLVFPGALVGVPIKRAAKKARTSIDSLGVASTYKVLDDLRFVGHIGSTRKEEIITAIDLTPSGGWELPVGDESTVTLEFKAVAKGSNRSAVQMYRIAA